MGYREECHMNAIVIATTLAAFPSTKEMASFLIWLAIAAIVIWAVIALVKASGLPIPQPVWIVLAALVGILLILLIAKLFGMVSM
jgi:hypothetical protein